MAWFLLLVAGLMEVGWAIGLKYTEGFTRKEPGMNTAVRACIVLALSNALPATAESLRCNGQIASEGDSKVSVLYKCGQPLLKDAFCAQVYSPHSLYAVPEPFASAYVPCQPIEEWLYERGPGELTAIVRFRAGVVQSIRYGRAPQ